MNNSFYGKTIENIRKRLNIGLIDKSDTHGILNRQSKLSFDDKIAEYEKFNLYFFKKGNYQIYKTYLCWILCIGIIKTFNV